MKTKKQLTIITLITCLLVIGIIFGEDVAKAAVYDIDHNGMGWQAQTKRESVLYSDGIRITTGPSVGTSGVGWSIGVSSNFSTIECCRMTTLKQSWCNFNADDSRCAD